MKSEQERAGLYGGLIGWCNWLSVSEMGVIADLSRGMHDLTSPFERVSNCCVKMRFRGPCGAPSE